MKKEKMARMKEKNGDMINKLKSLLGPLIILVIIGIGILVIAFWKKPPEEEQVIEIKGYEGQEEEFVLENDDLKFTLDPQTTQFTVTKKSTGRVWYSNPENASNDSVALALEKAKLQSTLLLTYSTENGVDTLYNNYNYSMENQLYHIEQGDDYVKVLYTIGDTAKEYVIPPVIEEERLNALIDKMSKSDATKVLDYYKKYDINNLGKKDNKEELLAVYPILETEVVYILRSTTKDNMKKKLEEFFTAAGYTYEEYIEDKALDLSETVSDKPVFNVSIIYRLEGEELVVEVPFNEIEYKKDYPVYYLNLLPYFGAGGTDDIGYMLVPEGGGAIINFNNGKVSQNSYYANVYGWDNAQERDSVVHETRTYFNTFGIVNGDSSFLCILEDGVSYASIQADISGKNNSYNYVNATYNVLHRNKYDVSDRTTAEMYVYEEVLPDEDIVQRYHFIDSNDYSDMAKVYQEYLVDRYDGYFTMNSLDQPPVAIEILGAVDKIKQVCGVPVTKPLELTTFNEAYEIIQQLVQDGFNNMSVKYTGWMNGGMEHSVLNKVKLVSQLGSKKEFQNLIQKTKELGVAIYLDGMTNYAYNSDLMNGFFSFRDAARFVSKERVELYPFSKITYGESDWLDSYYLLKTSMIWKMADQLVETANSYGTGVSFRDYGYELSSDFNEEDLVTRENSMKAQAEQLKSFYDDNQNILINMGNDYAIAYTSMVTNMDLGGTAYTIIDQSIPFYQMAIHGYKNYTGESLNLIQNTEEELLKSAEYGAGLSFTFMNESTFTLQTTYYTQYFGAEYSSWYNKAVEIYTRYNEELGHTFSQKIVDHCYETNTLACTTYEDGTKVYVNYGYEDAIAADGSKVSARDYAVKR